MPDGTPAALSRYTSGIHAKCGRAIKPGQFQTERDSAPQNPALLDAPMVLTVQHTYDAEGRAKSVTRSSIPDSAHIGAQTTSWNYDGAGRKVAELQNDEIGTYYRLDAAGNVDTIETRRGFRIFKEYDLLGRLRQVITPGDYQQWQIDLTTARAVQASCGGNPCIPPDTATFSYDQVGNLLVAKNGDSYVSRAYSPSGLLLVDTLRIRNSGATDPAMHTYVLRYGYDLAGRRIWMKHPANVVSGAGLDSVAYAYDDTTGALTGVRDVLGNTFGLGYNLAGGVAQLSYPGGVTETRNYDGFGRMNVRTEGTSASSYRLDSLWFDTHGRMVKARIDGGTAGASYSGLDMLLDYEYESRPTNGRTTGSDEMYRYDALGNVYYSSVYSWWPVIGCTANGESTATEQPIYGSDGRLRTKNSDDGSGVWREKAYYEYDAEGNTIESGTTPHPETAGSPLDHVIQNYGVDGKLRNSTRWNITGTSGTVVVEQSRYDALGRRIWRQVTWGQPCQDLSCRDFVERTLWDGNDVLYEIRAPMDGAEESDTPGSNGSPRFYGTVSYTHGLQIDHPLGVIRQNYESSTFLVVPHYNWRGLADLATYADGSTQHLNTDGTQTFINFPQKSSSAYMNSLGTTPAGQSSWFGSLIESKQDMSGQLYMRNRFYDPATGRFTQEDPIGLAGGLNAYGFAQGDPVTYSDPFGLWPWTDAIAQAIANWGAGHGGIAGSVALNAGAALNAGLEASGINAAAEAGDKIGNGQVVQGLGEAAILIGGAKAGGYVARKVAGALAAGAGAEWSLGTGKSATKWANQMQARGWTAAQISEAIQSGEQFAAPNNLNPSNGATRFVHPSTGRSVVLDKVTSEVIHVGGDGFKY